MTAIVTDDGKISIPRELRDALGFATGSVVELQNQAGKLVAWKAGEPDAFDQWRGRGQLPANTSADEYLRLTRDGDGR